MILSVSHTTQDLVFVWNMTDPLVVNPEIELPQLDISNNYTTDCTIEYSTGNFTCIQIVFNLRRRLGYHLFHTYIPSALIVVMSWIAFWIKPEAIPARVTLGVTSLLTLGEDAKDAFTNLTYMGVIFLFNVKYSNAEHTVSTVTATSLLRKSYRHMDVIVQCVRIFVTDGIRSRK